MSVIDQVIRAYGGRKALAKAFGCTNAAITNWKRRGIPKHAIPKIHLDTGIPLKKLDKSTV